MFQGRGGGRDVAVELESAVGSSQEVTPGLPAAAVLGCGGTAGKASGPREVDEVHITEWARGGLRWH